MGEGGSRRLTDEVFLGKVNILNLIHRKRSPFPKGEGNLLLRTVRLYTDVAVAVIVRVLGPSGTPVPTGYDCSFSPVQVTSFLLYYYITVPSALSLHRCRRTEGARA